MKVNVPTAVGVPLRSPELETERPGAGAPSVFQVAVPTAPVSWSWNEYAIPKVAGGSEFVVMVIAERLAATPRKRTASRPCNRTGTPYVFLLREA